MRLRDRGRRRHADMRMNVDRRRLRPHLASGFSLFARGGRAVSVGVGHGSFLSFVIPGHRAAASSESITTGLSVKAKSMVPWLWIPALASLGRNDQPLEH